MSRHAMLAMLVLMFGMVSQGQAGQYFSEDFDSGLPGEFSGAGSLVPVGGFASHGGFAGNFLVNSTWGNPAAASVFTFQDLPTHTGIRLGFLLAVINSWDGSIEIDSFNVEVDGTRLLSANFRNFPGLGQGYAPPPGGVIIDRPGVQLGFGGNSDWVETAYDMGFDPVLQAIPHSSDTLTIRLFGTYGGMNVPPHDEYWAIDNLSVELLGTVPEPSSVISAVLGVAFAAGYSRGKRVRSGSRARE